jgi:hypothetical protein
MLGERRRPGSAVYTPGALIGPGTWSVGVVGGFPPSVTHRSRYAVEIVAYGGYHRCGEAWVDLFHGRLNGDGPLDEC